MSKFIIEEDFLNILLKSLDTTPSFKQDKTAGEGTPGEDEVAYVKSMNDLLKSAYEQVIKIPIKDSLRMKTTKLDKIMKEFNDSAQKSAKEHVTKTFLKYQDKANQRAEKLGLNTSNDRTILEDFLLPYQENAIRKNTVILREKLLDNMMKIEYFGVTYGKTK